MKEGKEQERNREEQETAVALRQLACQLLQPKQPQCSFQLFRAWLSGLGVISAFWFQFSLLLIVFLSSISCPSVHREDRDQKRLVLAKIFLMFSSWKCWSLFILTSRLGERTIIILVLQMRNLRLSDIPKVIQLVRSRGRIWVMDYLNLESCFYPLWSPASMLHSLLTCSHLL